MLKKRGNTWWTQFTRPDGQRIRRSLKTRDKSAAAILKREIIHKTAMACAGIVDPFEQHKKRPLSEHVDEWHEALVAKGNTTKHADRSKALVIGVFEGCGFNRWGDISASSVQQWIGDRREAGISAHLSLYLTPAVKFCIC